MPGSIWIKVIIVIGIRIVKAALLRVRIRIVEFVFVFRVVLFVFFIVFVIRFIIFICVRVRITLRSIGGIIIHAIIPSGIRIRPASAIRNSIGIGRCVVPVGVRVIAHGIALRRITGRGKGGFLQRSLPFRLRACGICRVRRKWGIRCVGFII